MEVRQRVLEVRGLRKQFGGVTVADDLHFGVEEGTIHCVIGPNGAGKTTLFNMISGFVFPDQGVILFNGKPVNALPPEQRARMGIGRSFQHPRVFADLTVLDNILVALRQPLSAEGEAARIQRGIDLLGWVGLQEFAGYLARELSHGDQKRLDIALALATEPQLLLLDEPTAGMTGKETEEMADLVLQWRQRGMTIVVIEHDMGFVRDIAQRISVLYRGKVVVEGSIDEIEGSDIVKEVYLGTAVV